MASTTSLEIRYEKIDKNYIIIPKDTLIYRCAPKLDNVARYCKETGKTGLYFSTYQLQALAMCIEYGKGMNLGIFKLKEDIKVILGKYKHKNLDKKYYIKFLCWYREGKVRHTENISHFDPDIYCMDLSLGYEIALSFGRLKNTKKHGELFISENDLKYLEKINEYYVPLKGLIDILDDEKYIPNSENYLKHCISP